MIGSNNVSTKQKINNIIMRIIVKRCLYMCRLLHDRQEREVEQFDEESTRLGFR